MHVFVNAHVNFHLPVHLNVHANVHVKVNSLLNPVRAPLQAVLSGSSEPRPKQFADRVALWDLCSGLANIPTSGPATTAVAGKIVTAGT